MNRPEYVVQEAEFLLTLGESEYSIAKSLGISVDTLERRWRQVKGSVAPWVQRRKELAELGVRKHR